MAQINFPVPTSDGQTFEADTGVIYTYNGTPPNGFWSATFQADGIETLDDRYIKVDDGGIQQTIRRAGLKINDNSTGDTIVLNANGSAEFAGTIDVGNLDIASNSGIGCSVRSDGLVRAQRASGSTSAVFQAWRGSFNSASISANGSAEFAGNVESNGYLWANGPTSYIVVNRTGASGNTTVAEFGGSSVTSRIAADGSAGFAGRVDVGGLSVDSNLTPTAGASIEAFYDNGGFIQAYDRDAPGFTSLRIKSSNYELGSDGTATFAGQVKSYSGAREARLNPNGSLKLKTNETASKVIDVESDLQTEAFSVYPDGSDTFAGQVEIGNDIASASGTRIYNNGALYIRGDVNAASSIFKYYNGCLLYTSPSPRDATLSRMPSSA